MKALIPLTLWVALLGCTTNGVGGGDLSALQSFLSTPLSDRVSAALVQGDNRYLAIDRTAPCAPEASRQPSRRFSIPGTGGDHRSEKHRKVNAEARDYACAYNEELATLLGEAPPKALEEIP
jgi:hypothetical protein